MSSKRHRGDWVPIANFGQSVTVTTVSSADILLVSPRDESATAQGELAVVETQNEVLVERVVGQVRRTGSTDGSLCVERIRVGLLDDQGLAAFFSDSFVDSTEGNEPFLWQRVTVMDNGEEACSSIAHPFWSMVDCRSVRKLTRDQALFYSVQVFGADASVRVQPFLRSWARILA